MYVKSSRDVYMTFLCAESSFFSTYTVLAALTHVSKRDPQILGLTTQVSVRKVLPTDGWRRIITMGGAEVDIRPARWMLLGARSPHQYSDARLS